MPKNKLTVKQILNRVAKGTMKPSTAATLLKRKDTVESVGLSFAQESIEGHCRY